MNGIASVKFFNWLGEKDRDLWDWVTDNWGVDRSGRLFKLKEQRCYILYEGEDEGKDDNFVRAFQIAYDEIRAKEQVIDLTTKLLEEILSLHSLPVFDNFKWISFIALCRRVTDKSLGPGFLGNQQLQDLATQCRALYRSADTAIKLVDLHTTALVSAPSESVGGIKTKMEDFPEIGRSLEVLGLNGVQDFLRLEGMVEGRGGDKDKEGIVRFFEERKEGVRRVSEMARRVREVVLSVSFSLRG